MPFTGTVLDHLTKPRPDTRFCTGVLRQTYPAARPPVLPSIPGVAPARSTAPAVMTHPAPVGAPAAATATAAAAAAAAPYTTSAGASSAAVADGVSGSGPALLSGATGTAAGSNLAAAHHSTAAQGSEASAQQYEPAFATQRYTPAISPNPASQQADAVQTGSADQREGRGTQPVKDAPGTADAPKPETATTDVPPATAHTALKQEPEVNAGKQQGQGSNAAGSNPAHLASSSDAAASTAPAATALVTQAQQQPQQQQTQQEPQQQQAQQQAQQQPQQQPQQQLQAQQLQAATVLPVAAATAGQEPVASSASSAADPWNALDVAWDSDTPPAWPKLVCPWQVNPKYYTLTALRRTCTCS